MAKWKFRINISENKKANEGVSPLRENNEVRKGRFGMANTRVAVANKSGSAKWLQDFRAKSEWIEPFAN